MICQSRSTKPAAKSPAIRIPYGVGFLVPTIASERSDKIVQSPFTISAIGGTARSSTDFGHSPLSGVMKVPSAFAMAARLSSQLKEEIFSIRWPYLIVSYPPSSKRSYVALAPRSAISCPQNAMPGSMQAKRARRLCKSFINQNLLVVSTPVVHQQELRHRVALNLPRSMQGE